jgi:hypothetical protein
LQLCCNIGYVSDLRWLLLGHQLPTRFSNARVKTWRRLQQIGAVPTRNSVYVLPNTDQCREDFEWIRSEIVALGGEAIVFAADAISEGGAEDIVAAFRRSRDQDYRALKAVIDRLLRKIKGKARPTTVIGRLASRAHRTVRDRFQAIERIDFFCAEARDEAAASLAAFEQAVLGERGSAAPAQSALNPASFRGHRWVTRHRPGVDRMASAWLIRRFIDPNATFVFADSPKDLDVPFDMYTGEFSHHGDLCTFEVMAHRFGLESAAVTKIGQVVHDLDMKDKKYGLTEAAAIGRIVEGLRATHSDDSMLLEQGMAMFNALAHSFQSDEGAAGPSGAEPARASKSADRRAPARKTQKSRTR